MPTRDVFQQELDKRTVISVDNLKTDTAARAAVAEAAVSRLCAIPAALDWSQFMGTISAPRLTFGRYGTTTADIGLTAEQAYDAVSTARTSPVATYYVSSSGVDTNAGTQALPFRTMAKAMAAANAGGVPTKVIVTGYGMISDVHSRLTTPSTGNVSPTVDIAWIADGVVCTGPWDAIGAVTADATYTNTYSWAV